MCYHFQFYDAYVLLKLMLIRIGGTRFFFRCVHNWQASWQQVLIRYMTCNNTNYTPCPVNLDLMIFAACPEIWQHYFAK